jgi:hypothetical protein
MKYAMISVKAHPFTIPVLPRPSFLDGSLFTTIFIYPHPDNPKQYPLQIDWKYRLSHNNKHLTTFIAESRFIIEDDGIPFDFAQLDRFIKDIYLNAEIKYQEATTNTPLHGQTMPAMVGQNLEDVRKMILGTLQ